MLAIQRPRMGTNQPPDGSLPFGYSIDNTNDFPFLEPPEPAPGAPLLTDHDTRLLSNFFEDLTSDRYDMATFGEGLNFSEEWLGLPPQFMGTATSFGQQPTPSFGSPLLGLQPNNFHDAMNLGPNLMPPPPPPSLPRSPLEQVHSADVLAAAHALQNGHDQIHTNTGNDHSGLYGHRDMSQPMMPSMGQIRQPSASDFHSQDPRRSQPRSAAPLQTQDLPDDNLYAQMMFGSQETPRTTRPPVTLSFGSDANFMPHHGYIPPSVRETREALETEQHKYLGCLEVNKSAANTRPSSPSHDGPSGRANGKLVSSTGRYEDPDAPPRKRRKSAAKDEAGDDEEEAGSFSAKAAVRKRKSKLKLNGTSESAASAAEGGKRRKSAAVAKPPRENLSEEQKRENHIRSEQKRRTLIKEGFDDLCVIVPGLNGGGFSKSTMLTMTSEWLENFLQENDELRAKLAALS